MRLLLDVNVWVALLDDAHQHNRDALGLIQRPGLKIATCPLVENGVLRVLNVPRYGSVGPVGFEPVRAKMQMVCDDIDHQFWPDAVSLRHSPDIDWTRVYGHNQITDLYLLALAVEHGGALATFDHRISLNAVKTAKKQNLVLL